MADFESILKEVEQEVKTTTKPEPKSPLEVKSQKTLDDANQQIAEKMVKEINKKARHVQTKKLEMKMYSADELTKVKDYNHLKELYPCEYEVDGSTLWVHLKDTKKTLKMSTRYTPLLFMLEDVLSKFDGNVYFDHFPGYKVLLLLEKDGKRVQIVDNVHGTQKVYVWFESLDNRKDYGHYKKNAWEFISEILSYFGIEAGDDIKYKYLPKPTEKKASNTKKTAIPNVAENLLKQVSEKKE